MELPGIAKARAWLEQYADDLARDATISRDEHNCAHLVREVLDDVDKILVTVKPTQQV